MIDDAHAAFADHIENTIWADLLRMLMHRRAGIAKFGGIGTGSIGIPLATGA